jgi:hypothetical protein
LCGHLEEDRKTCCERESKTHEVSMFTFICGKHGMKESKKFTTKIAKRFLGSQCSYPLNGFVQGFMRSFPAIVVSTKKHIFKK